MRTEISLLQLNTEIDLLKHLAFKRLEEAELSYGDTLCLRIDSINIEFINDGTCFSETGVSVEGLCVCLIATAYHSRSDYVVQMMRLYSTGSGVL